MSRKPNIETTVEYQKGYHEGFLAGQQDALRLLAEYQRILKKPETIIQPGIINTRGTSPQVKYSDINEGGK